MLANKFPCKDSLVTFLCNGLLFFNKQNHGSPYFEYPVLQCQAVFPGRACPKCGTVALPLADGEAASVGKRKREDLPLSAMFKTGV